MPAAGDRGKWRGVDERGGISPVANARERNNLGDQRGFSPLLLFLPVSRLDLVEERPGQRQRAMQRREWGARASNGAPSSSAPLIFFS